LRLTAIRTGTGSVRAALIEAATFVAAHAIVAAAVAAAFSVAALAFAAELTSLWIAANDVVAAKYIFWFWIAAACSAAGAAAGTRGAAMVAAAVFSFTAASASAKRGSIGTDALAGSRTDRARGTAGRPADRPSLVHRTTRRIPSTALTRPLLQE